MRGISCCIILIFSLISEAQENYKFNHLTATDGLGNSNVLSISKDTNGFLYFGTENGLYRYDAYDFVDYKHEPKMSNALTNNYCWALLTDSENQLWIGNRGALNKFDPYYGTFSRYYINNEHKFNKTDYFIYSITESEKQQLWIGTINGLYTFDKQSHNFKKFTHKKLPSQIKQFRAVVKDRNGNTWIGTDESEHGGLFKFTTHSSDTLLQHATNTSNSLADNNISCLFVDDLNNLWIGHRKGLDKYEIEENRFVHYSYSSGKINSLSSNTIYCINQASNGMIWIGTDQGINILNPVNNTIIQLKHNKDDSKSILSNSIHAIFFDNEGTAWIGSRDGGVDIYDSRMFKYITYHTMPSKQNTLNNNNIQKFAEDEHENIWITTDGGGLNHFNPKTKTFTDMHKKYNTLFTNEKTIPILFDKDKNLWLGYWMGGVSIFKTNNGTDMQRVKNFPIPNKEWDDSPKALYVYQTSNNQIWLGTWYSGLFRYEPKHRKFNHFPTNDPAHEINNCVIHKLFEDHAHNLWIGTEDAGIYKLDLNTESITHFVYNEYAQNSLSSRSIYDIFQDSDKQIWIGTAGGGLNLFDSINNNFISYNKDYGLPRNSVYGILEDSKGRLWMSTDMGISMVKKNKTDSTLKLNCTHFDIFDGIQGKSFTKNAAFRASNGQLYFGGANGFNAFYPDSIAYNQAIPAIYLTELKVNYKTALPGIKNSPLKQKIEFTDTIVLLYNQSVISIKFTVLNYINPQKNQIYYTLENFDNEWILANKTREANYTNLNPGTYIFKVKASNNDGILNPKIKTLVIIIKPPFWKTWVFRIFMVILMILSIRFIYLWRVRDLKQKKRDLEEQVASRTQEIKKQNTLINDKNTILEIQKKELEEFTEELTVKTEELSASNEAIAEQRNQIEKANSTLRKRNNELNKANTELDTYKNQLERLVKIRTQALLIAKEQAEESDNLKTAFLQNLSHEIRTPMNAIKGFSDLLSANELSDEERCEYICIIQNNSNQLLSIVEDILTLSSLEVKQGKTYMQIVCVNQLLMDLIPYFEVQAKNKKLSLFATMPISEKLSEIYTDKIKLTQILNNLISNALKFTRSGSVEFGYEIVNLLETGHAVPLTYMQFFVKDTGIGIAPEMHDKIFERFRQADNSIQVNFGGSGLGLAISKAFVELLGGRIWVQSQKKDLPNGDDGGSVFYFTIPKFLQT